MAQKNQINDSKLLIICFLAIPATLLTQNLLLKKIENPVFSYLILSVILFGSAYYFLKTVYRSNQLVVNYIAFAFMALYIFNINLDIFYKWNPEKSSIYSSAGLIVLSIIFYLSIKTLVIKIISITFLMSLSIWIAHFQYIDLSAPYIANAIHFDIFYFPILQNLGGGQIFTNFIPQYGLYFIFWNFPLLELEYLDAAGLGFVILSLLTSATLIWALIKITDDWTKTFLLFSVFWYFILCATQFNFPIALHPVHSVVRPLGFCVGLLAICFPSIHGSIAKQSLTICLIMLTSFDYGLMATCSLILTLLIASNQNYPMMMRANRALTSLIALAAAAGALYLILCALTESVLPPSYIVQLFEAFGIFAGSQNFGFKSTLLGIFGYSLAVTILARTVLFKRQALSLRDLTFGTYCPLFGIMLGYRYFTDPGMNSDNIIWPSVVAIVGLILTYDQKNAGPVSIGVRVVASVSTSWIAICLLFILTTPNALNASPMFASNDKRLIATGDIETSDVKYRPIEPPWIQQLKALRSVATMLEGRNDTFVVSRWSSLIYADLGLVSPIPHRNAEHLWVYNQFDDVVDAIDEGIIRGLIFDHSPRFTNTDLGYQKLFEYAKARAHRHLIFPLEPCHDPNKNKWVRCSVDVLMFDQ